ncbi:hypothetical protein ACI2KS_10135 [Pseudomonas sp. NPDC087358]|uniref:hypothetical protein n=1 Tax=Pseudomonas sp. NPDC087358 TaxID=3364439 RepID=UPI00384B0C91
MNAALQLAQFEYDNRLPVDLDENPAITEWIEQNAQRLMDGETVTWGYKKSDKGQVTVDEFVTAVQEHLTSRQIDGQDNRDAFARLCIANLVWGHRFDGRDQAQYLMGSKSALKDIAVNLLLPHAARAVELNAEWQRQSEEVGF